MPDGNAARAIGRLEGKLDALVDAIGKGQDESKQGRSRIYEELEQVRTYAAESRAQITALKEQMDDAAPVIKNIQKWQERFIGARMLVIFVAGSAGAAILALWQWVSVKLGVR